jgi:hypothetical protein
MKSTKSLGKTERKFTTINHLGELTHADRRHIRRWMIVDGVNSKTEHGQTLFDEIAAVEAIERHQRPPRNTQASPSADDPPRGGWLGHLPPCDRDCKLTLPKLLEVLPAYGLNENQISEVHEKFKSRCPIYKDLNDFLEAD